MSGGSSKRPGSRRDVEAAATAPHDQNREQKRQKRGHPPFSESPQNANVRSPSLKKGDVPFFPIFPPALRPARWDRATAPGGVPWRFRVPDGRVIEFHDGLCGTVRRTAGIDFGDFVIWRRDDLAAYELAVVADDHAMEIAEVVRGEDLLTSTARQLLIYEALGWQPPAFAHAPLVCDAAGRRLAKRSGGLAIRDLREAGWTPSQVLTAPLTPPP